MLCIRSAGYFKPNSSEQPTMDAKFQLPLAGQFMNVKPRTLHVAALALRIVPTRTLTAHETPILTRFKDNRGVIPYTRDVGPKACQPREYFWTQMVRGTAKISIAFQRAILARTFV